MPKKAYAIYPRTKQAQMFGLETSFGHITFGKKTVVNTRNKALADEINTLMKGDAYAVQDEQLARAHNGEVWDVQTKNGQTNVKTLHNYNFTVIKPKPPTKTDRLKKWLSNKNAYWFFWFWSTINQRYNREIGIRIFGVEFTKEFKS